MSKVSFDDPYEDDACSNCGDLFGRDVHESRIENLCTVCYSESMAKGSVQNTNEILKPKVISHPPTPEQKAAFEAAQRLTQGLGQRFPEEG